MFRLLPAAVALLPLLGVPQSGQVPRAAARVAGKAALDALVTREMRERAIPGVAVAVVENGVITLQGAYGVSNLETDTPMTTDSVFELASVTKPITATALMMLVEQGKVGLDDPLTKYIDNTPAAWGSITVRQLLTHTSGLDSLSVPRIGGAAPLTISTALAFQFIAEAKPRFPPGEAGWYSDAGYFLLGMVIEKASGQSYRQFLQQRIFDPAGMKESSVLDKARVLKRRVATYTRQNGVLVNWRRDWDHELPSFFGVFSTLKDMARWDAALRRGVLLAPAALAGMWTPSKLTNGQFVRVLDRLQGLGWRLVDVNGRRAVEHSGASGTFMLRFLDEPLTILVFTNLDNTSGRHAMLLARSIAGLARPALRPPHDLRPSAAGDPSSSTLLARLLGDIAARRASPVMSDAYRAWYESAPGSRAWMASQLTGGTTPQYLGADDRQGTSLWGEEPVGRVVHYSIDVKNQRVYLSIGITAEGKVGSVDFYLR
jgi:CubicO group peptidase (beta-lactamase class C family)